MIPEGQKTCQQCGAIFQLPNYKTADYLVLKHEQLDDYCLSCRKKVRQVQIPKEDLEKKEAREHRRQGDENQQRIMAESSMAEQQIAEHRERMEQTRETVTPEPRFIQEVEGDTESKMGGRLHFRVAEQQWSDVTRDPSEILWKLEVEEGQSYQISRRKIIQEDTQEKVEHFFVRNYTDGVKLMITPVPEEWAGKKIKASAFFEEQEQEGHCPIPEIISQIASLEKLFATLRIQETEAPYPDIEVQLPQLEQTITTDQNGYFCLPKGVQAGNFKLLIEETNYEIQSHLEEDPEYILYVDLPNTPGSFVFNI